MTPGYPLAWPENRPRTRHPAEARFRDAGLRLTLTKAKARLTEQLKMIGAAGAVLSTNIRYTASGTRDQNVSRSEPADRGVALYFGLHGRPHVLACDRWDTIADNIAAIAAHIEALRGQERWGCATVQQAFAGHVALPPPEQWWQVLGVRHDSPDEVIEAAYRALARKAHPDAGGTEAQMQRLNAARDAARKERNV